MNKKILFAVIVLLAYFSLVYASLTEKELEVLRQKAKEYNGSQSVILRAGITLNPDSIAVEKGFAFLAFKGKKPKDKKEYEYMAVIPLNEIERVNDKTVDIFSANVILAGYYLNEGKDTAKAIEAYERALEAKPGNAFVIEDLTFVYNSSGFFQKSIELGKKGVLALPQDEKIWFNLAMAYVGNEDMDDAKKCFNKVFEIDNKSESAALAYFNLGVINYSNKQTVEAEKQLNQAKELLPKYGKKYEKQIKQIEELLGNIKQSVAANNNSPLKDTPDYFKNLGDSLLEQDKNSQALNAYKKALVLYPNMAGAHLGMGRAFARLKEYDKAIEHIELALKADESVSKKALPQLIFLYLFKDDIGAVKYLNKLIEIDEQLGSNLATQVFNARIYGIKEIDGGFVVEHSFVEASTGRVLGVVKKADSFIDSGEFDKAISIYKEFIAREDLMPKEKAALLHTIGMVYSIKLNKPQEGIIYLRQAVEFDPEEISFKIGLIDAYRLLEEYGKALDEINKVLSVDPNSKYGLYFQGAIYLKKKEWEKAVESWDKLNKIDKVLFALIETEYDKAKNLKGAVAGDRHN